LKTDVHPDDRSAHAERGHEKLLRSLRGHDRVRFSKKDTFLPAADQDAARITRANSSAGPLAKL
jgi:hypothetical protein